MNSWRIESRSRFLLEQVWLLFLSGVVSCNLNTIVHNLKSLGIRNIYGSHKIRDDSIRCSIHSIRCGKYVLIKILSFQVHPLFF